MGRASDRLRKRDRFLRLEVWGAAACWLGLAIANTVVSETIRWYPDFVGAMAGLTALSTGTLAAFPKCVFAFRVGGTLAIGTLVLRLVSIGEGLAIGLGDDFAALGMAALCVTAMLIFTYWTWWLGDVKVWHKTHTIGGVS